MGRETDQIIQDLRARLPEYLEAFGRRSDRGNFRCPNAQNGHKNGDQNPSAGIVPGTNEEVWYCFSERIAGNIFHAAHMLEGLPMEGSPFFSVTIPKLCERFRMPVPPMDDITAEDKEKISLYRLHTDAYAILKEHSNKDKTDKAAIDRGWTGDWSRQHDIFTSCGQDVMFQKLQDLGWNKDFLRKAGINPKGYNLQLFAENNLVFVIRNVNGSVIGFASRRMDWQKGQKDKYVNSPSSLIYEKSKTLYNLHRSKKHGVIYIVEGYADVVTMMHNGLDNAVAIGGLAFSENHFDTLINHKIGKVIICMDGDQEGQKQNRSIIEMFGHRPTSLQMEVLELSNDKDPDSFIKAHGIDEFKKIQTITPFEYKLQHTDYNVNLHELCQSMIPLVLAEPSRVKRDLLVKTLARHTEVSESSIRAEVERIENTELFQKDLEMSNIAQRVQSALRLGKDPSSVITEAHEEIQSIHNSRIGKGDEIEEYIREIQDIKEVNDAKGSGLSGWNMGSLLSFQDAFDGFPKEGCLIPVGGRPNCGKTSFLQNLGWQTAISNDDVLVIYMSTDDSRKKLLPATVAMDQGLTLQQVYHPSEYVKTPIDAAKYDEGWNRLRQFSDRFVIKDVRHGDTVEALHHHIRTYRKRYPGKNIIVILDNFHKLGGHGKEELRVKFRSASDRLKKIAVSENIPIVMTVELTKLPLSEKPTLNSISESSQVEYDADAAILIHNDLHCNPHDSMITWNCVLNGKTYVFPILELSVDKNKISSFKGKLYYKFDPLRRKMSDLTDQELKEMHTRVKNANDAKKLYKNGDPQGQLQPWRSKQQSR